MLRKLEGIVLRTKDYGESHKVVNLYTKERGKMAVMARGAKKPKSRLAAVAQPFIHAQFLCFEGSGMGTLSQGDILNSHYPLRSDLYLTAYAAYLAELLDQSTEEREPQPTLFEWFRSSLEHLEGGTDPDILARMFELKMLDTAGYRPFLDGCVSCRATERPLGFSVSQGGFLCLDCAEQRRQQVIPLSTPAARILKLLQRISPDRLGQVEVKPETKAQLEKAMGAFIDEYGGFHLKSRTFLDRMRSDGLID
ncbi:DNA repair protein RecO [Marinithermofilum abyssi]|uniref:DNA repair protein RecO n=1 Tax=Marinithermofilum abyssi TaxID=1571185 RepID=UPI001664D52B|nr:DNA repair protein RecO [Marinithermofilum abyssi]